MFKKWLYKHMKKAWEETNENRKVEPRAVAEADVPLDGLRITIASATGGKIVEYNKRKRNDGINKYQDSEFRREVYLITEEENFIESFAKITSMELMR